MKNLAYLTIATLLFGAAAFLLLRDSPKPKAIEYTVPCIIERVEYYRLQQRSIAQLDPEWHATTTDGRTFTTRHEVKPGDTIFIKIVKFEN